MKKVVGSIVVFNPNLGVLKQTISSFLRSAPKADVYIWDNSPEDKISSAITSEYAEKVHYFKSPTNLGYGSGHNEVFKKITVHFDYFCILNPDLEIPTKTISEITEYLKSNPNIGLVSCLIRGTDGVIHEVHKYLPSFWSYISSLTKRFLKLPEKPKNTVSQLAKGPPFTLPIISGCFMFFTKEHFEELSGFDDSFFLYFEDYDLSLRSYLKNKSVILTGTYVIHKWARDSRRNWNLFWIHLKSGIHFYRKWGLNPKINNRNRLSP